MGAGLLATGSLRCDRKIAVKPSRASPLPQDLYPLCWRCMPPPWYVAKNEGITGEAFIHSIPASVIVLAGARGLPLIKQPYLLKVVIDTHLIGTALLQMAQTKRSHHDILALDEEREALDVAENLRPATGLCDFSELEVLRLLQAVSERLMTPYSE